MANKNRPVEPESKAGVGDAPPRQGPERVETDSVTGKAVHPKKDESFNDETKAKEAASTQEEKVESKGEKASKTPVASSEVTFETTEPVQYRINGQLFEGTTFT